MVLQKNVGIKERIMEYENLCKKCFLKKNKLSKKNIDRIVFTSYMEECDCCHKIDKLVEYIMEEDEDGYWA